MASPYAFTLGLSEEFVALVATRLRACNSPDCIYNDERNCRLKEILIEDGRCLNFNNGTLDDGKTPPPF
jgi:hypothetical protein